MNKILEELNFWVQLCYPLNGINGFVAPNTFLSCTSKEARD